MEIVRAQVMHTPRDPFEAEDALETFSDGGLAVADGRIEAVGSFDEVRRVYPGAEVRDERDAVLLPGLVDTHVHFPQLAIIGSMGLGLLDWLERYALPEEARMADAGYARRVAREFVAGLAANGTTTALVFGSHFPAAQDALFEEAERSGLRIASGLVVSDRNLLPELHTDPDGAYEASRELAARWHGRGRLRYAVTPRFSLSCSEGMLEACGALHSDVSALVTSHMNENLEEVEAVRGLFDAFDDYLHTYEHFGLVGESTVLAHNAHPSEAELARLGAARASVAHCPESNACLGSGLFPLNGHLDHDPERTLGALFALAREESVADVRVAGEVVGGATA